MSLATICLQKFSASPAPVGQVGAQYVIALELWHKITPKPAKARSGTELLRLGSFTGSGEQPRSSAHGRLPRHQHRLTRSQRQGRMVCREHSEASGAKRVAAAVAAMAPAALHSGLRPASRAAGQQHSALGKARGGRNRLLPKDRGTAQQKAGAASTGI